MWLREVYTGIRCGINTLSCCCVLNHLNVLNLFKSEILSAEQSILINLKGPHLFAHANLKYDILTLPCNFSILPKLQLFPLVI